MFQKLTNSWTMFFVMTFGILLLMISIRPELQRRPGHEHAPGQTLEYAGHALTWTTATVLAYRMVRGIREG